MPLLRTVSLAHVRGLAMVLATLLLPGKAQAQELMVTVTDSAGAAVDDAIVALYAENASAGPEPAPQVHVVDQVGKQFAPRIAAIHAGDSISFPNSDNIRHHVYSFSPAKSFELPLYHGVVAVGTRVQGTQT